MNTPDASYALCLLTPQLFEHNAEDADDALSVYCLQNGWFAQALDYATRVASLRPSLSSLLRRFCLRSWLLWDVPSRLPFSQIIGQIVNDATLERYKKELLDEASSFGTTSDTCLLVRATVLVLEASHGRARRQCVGCLTQTAANGYMACKKCYVSMCLDCGRQWARLHPEHAHDAVDASRTELIQNLLASLAELRDAQVVTQRPKYNRQEWELLLASGEFVCGLYKAGSSRCMKVLDEFVAAENEKDAEAQKLLKADRERLIVELCLNDVFQAGVFAEAARDTCLLEATGAEAHEWLQWSGATERKVNSRSDFIHFFDELAPRFGDRSVRVLSVLVPATEMTIFTLFQIGPICVLGLLAPQLASSYSDFLGKCIAFGRAHSKCARDSFVSSSIAQIEMPEDVLAQAEFEFRCLYRPIAAVLEESERRMVRQKWTNWVVGTMGVAATTLGFAILWRGLRQSSH